MNNKSCTRLCVCGFGIAFGIVSGLYMFLFALASMRWGYGSVLVAQYATVMPGFAASPIGGLWGALWGFLEGLVSGLILALVYNLVAYLCFCCCKSK